MATRVVLFGHSELIRFLQGRHEAARLQAYVLRLQREGKSGKGIYMFCTTYHAVQKEQTQEIQVSPPRAPSHSSTQICSFAAGPGQKKIRTSTGARGHSVGWGWGATVVS